MKKTLLMFAAASVLVACGGNKENEKTMEAKPEVYEASDMEFVEDTLQTEDEDSYSGAYSGGTAERKPVEAAEEDIEFNENVDEAEAAFEEAAEAAEAESELKAAAKGAYERGKEKYNEKKQEIEESETYQNAKEKAGELKEKATEKATDLLNDMFN
jgi:hypothetical protein